MRKLLLLTALSLPLVACQPIVGQAQGTRANVAIASGALTFRNGDATPALKVVLTAEGITTTDPRCTATFDQITNCRLGDVAAGTNADPIAFTGALISGAVSWRTPEGRVRGLLLP